MSSKAILKISAISNSDSTNKEQEILDLLNQASDDQEATVHLINALVKQQTLPVKQILVKYIDSIESTFPQDAKIKLYEEMISIFSPPTAIVYLPLMKTILNLTSIYESHDQYSKALDTLKTLQIDSLVQDFEDLLSFQKFKVEVNTRIAKDSLKIDDFENAEAYISRISPILSELESNGVDDLILNTYKISVETMVKVGKWSDAATKLLILDKEQFDIPTLKYAILSQHDSLKARLLNNIVESSHILQNVLDTPLSIIFEKMYDQRIIYYDDFLQVLEYYLETNDLGLSKDYISQALSKALVENNLIAASKIYDNCSVKNFAEILQLDEAYVEEIAANMIRDQRLDALIDDINIVIEFNSQKRSPLKEWHGHMIESCTILDKIVDKISQTKPSLADSYLNT
ncbi:unnamed protein product [Wickerhamomyces anomalus]